MSIFSSLFKKPSEDPKIKFGRFSDSYKEDVQYDYWDKAIAEYEAGNYLPSFEHFLRYLKDDSISNVSYRKEGNKIHFTLFQGSKKMTGFATSDRLYAEVKIAEYTKLDIGFLRGLIEKNFHLKYSRYALDNENCITMVFDTHALDASPYKLYYALKELGTNADRQDDVMISEFDVLKRVNTGHIRDISQKEKEVKYVFLQDSIREVLAVLKDGKLNLSHYPGAASYLILSLVYRLDFLIKPEGITMENIEQIHNIFFKDSTINAHRKNEMMRNELNEMLEITPQEFKEEIYEVLSTFGITQPSGIERLRSMIQSDLENMNWYQDNNHKVYAMAVPGYIVGYCLYNYALPSPVRALLLLYYKIFSSTYFEKLGFENMFLSDNGSLNKKSILREIKTIEKKYADQYAQLKINARALSFIDDCHFARSYMQMLYNVKLNRIKK